MTNDHDSTRAAVREFLKHNPGARNDEIASAVGCALPTAKKYGGAVRRELGVSLKKTGNGSHRLVAIADLITWLRHALACQIAACEECQRIRARLQAQDFGDVRSLVVAMEHHRELEALAYDVVAACENLPSYGRARSLMTACHALKVALFDGPTPADFPRELRERMASLMPAMKTATRSSARRPAAEL